MKTGKTISDGAKGLCKHPEVWHEHSPENKHNGTRWGWPTKQGLGCKKPSKLFGLLAFILRSTGKHSSLKQWCQCDQICILNKRKSLWLQCGQGTNERQSGLQKSVRKRCSRWAESAGSSDSVVVEMEGSRQIQELFSKWDRYDLVMH